MKREYKITFEDGSVLIVEDCPGDKESFVRSMNWVWARLSDKNDPRIVTKIELQF